MYITITIESEDDRRIIEFEADEKESLDTLLNKIESALDL